MEIIISKSLDTPIYEQIEKQIEEKIKKGQLKAHDKLPGMRTLAKDLKVSVITTKRAYDDLERDGYIYTLPGKGSFINSIEISNITNNKKIEKDLEIPVSKLIKIAKESELGLNELLTFIYKEWKDERD
ncbi:GntR family transcriptional regulator [Peptoniphilus olsenii]|uniref:GntR family transcriptional regulator n=1 Tax=Peptoniphilus olsenii TaxID=411570 RepID=A0ABV2JDJ2_9FIRM